MDCQSRKHSAGNIHRGATGNFLSSLKQLIWSSSESTCEESSDASSESDSCSSQGINETSSDDELNQGISELSVDSDLTERGERGVAVEVSVDVRTAAQDGNMDELSIGEHQEYTFEDHHLVDLSRSADFDSTGFLLDSSGLSTVLEAGQLQDDDDDDVR